MSPFGLLWIAVILIASLSGLNALTVVLILSTIMHGSAPVIMVSDFSISCQDVAIVAFLIKYFTSNKMVSLRSRSVSAIAMLFVATSFIGGIVSLTIFNGYEMLHFWADFDGTLYIIGKDRLDFSLSFFVLIARLSLYLLGCLCVFNASASGLIDRHTVFVRTIQSGLCIVLLFGLLQWMDSYSYLNLNWLMELYYGNRLSASTGYSRDYLALYSVFPEPSYCGPWLAGMGLVLLSRGKELFRHHVLLGILCLIGAVMTNSATAAVVVVAGVLAISIGRIKVDARLLFFTAALFFLVILASSDVRDFIDMALGKLSSDSGVIRVNYIFQSYKIMFDTFFLGAGFGQTQGMSFLGGLLSQVGIIGTTIFIVYLFYSYRSIVSTPEGACCKSFFLLMLIATEISSSGLIYSVDLWFALYLCASQSGCSMPEVIKGKPNGVCIPTEG